MNSTDSAKKEVTAGWKIFVRIITVVGLLGGVWAAKELIDDEINKTVDSRLNDEIVLRKIAAQTRPSLIFNGKGSILHDMGVAQYLKPDDIEITEHVNDQGIVMPTKLHIGFVKPVSFPPIVTPLYDTASLTAVNSKGLDWDFLINWTVAPEKTNDEARVYRLEIVP